MRKEEQNESWFYTKVVSVFTFVVGFALGIMTVQLWCEF